MSDLQVQSNANAGATVVTLRGDAGAANAPSLERELQRLAAQKAGLWVFDLSGVTFISSVGLVALLAFQRNASRQGAQVRLAAVPACVLEVLRGARLANAFRIEPSVEAATRGG